MTVPLGISHEFVVPKWRSEQAIVSEQTKAPGIHSSCELVHPFREIVLVPPVAPKWFGEKGRSMEFARPISWRICYGLSYRSFHHGL